MAPTLVSLEEYLNTSYEPDVEYVDGELVERTMGTTLHGILQTIVTSYFHQARHTYRIRSMTDVRLFVTAIRYRIPDVAVVEAPFPGGKVLMEAPAIAVEILSPEDRFAELREKCSEYVAIGIANVVILDPMEKIEYRFLNGSFQQLHTAQALRLPKSRNEIPFPTAELFAELDEA